MGVEARMAQTDQQVVEVVSAALETALALVEDKEGWKQEKEKDGTVIKSKKNAEGRKVWLCEATCNVSAAVLWGKIQDTGSLTSWNTTLTESRVIRELGDGIKLSYQVTTEGGARSWPPDGPGGGGQVQVHLADGL